MKSTYDVIVLGTGGVGSAALFHLASRGLRVAGLDQFPPAHGFGSSHGQSRIIRKAYFEHPDYVPLLERAYFLWDELSRLSGRSDLFERTGLIQIGPNDGVVIPGVLESAARHGLRLETLTADEAGERFPQYRVPEECAVVYESDAGLLRVEDCVLAYLNAAQATGADLHTGVTVHRWNTPGGGVELETSAGVFRAGALVITAGSWAPQLLGGLGIPLEVRRKPLFWFKSNSGAHQINRACPCFFYERPEGQFYGFPEMEPGGGVKVACHTGGEVIADPASVDRRLDERDLAKVRQFTREWFPEVGAELLRHETCLYTMSPDEHFIVDRHPGHPQVAFAAGLSGHGFKFASVLGEILSDLIVDGGTALPAEFLGVRRFL
jgi:sarcosine oxidase